MDSGLISRRYAEALMMYAVKHGSQEGVFADTKRLSRCFHEYPVLNRVLSNRVLPVDEKAEVVYTLVGESITDEFRNFIRLVLANKRENFLHMMCFSYIDHFRRLQGIINVDIVVAQPVDDQTSQRISDKVAEITKLKPRLTFRVDKSIIGGYIIKWDTYRLDSSVSGRLKKIEQYLTDSDNNL